VQLLFAIEKDTPVKTDTEAVLKTQGLTGIAYVELSGGSPSAPPLVSAAPNQLPTIRTIPSLSARLENVLGTVLANLDRTAANVNAILNDQNRAMLAKILTDTSTVMSTLASQRDVMRNGIANAARTAGNAAKATDHLDVLIRKVAATTDEVKSMVNQTAQVGASARKTVDEMNAGVHELTGDTIPDINQLLGQLNALSNSLRRLSDQTERNPSSLLRGTQPVPYGPGEKPSP
jgi:phospholipid/cholesterol/gamma-HCH transport system substrate-binding protein